VGHDCIRTDYRILANHNTWEDGGPRPDPATRPKEYRTTKSTTLRQNGTIRIAEVVRLISENHTVGDEHLRFNHDIVPSINVHKTTNSRPIPDH